MSDQEQPHISPVPSIIEDDIYSKEELLSIDKKEMKRNLLYLNSKDENEDKESSKEILSYINDQLTNLEKKYPNDYELKTLRLMWNDLDEDCILEQDMNLDSFFIADYVLIKGEIEAAGVHKENPKDSVVKETVAKLEAVGVQPEYVVTTGNPSAPIVVYFMQIHSNPGMTDEMMNAYGVKESQAEISKGIIGSVQADIGHTLYTEGLPIDFSVTPEILSKIRASDPSAKEMASFTVQEALGGKLNTIGIEDMDLLMESLKTSGRPNSSLKYRANVMNILLAQNISDSIKETGETVSFLTLGAGHENDMLGKNPLRFSEALAYNGVNVIVVDASESFDPKKIGVFLNTPAGKEQSLAFQQKMGMNNDDKPNETDEAVYTDEAKNR